MIETKAKKKWPAEQLKSDLRNVRQAPAPVDRGPRLGDGLGIAEGRRGRGR